MCVDTLFLILIFAYLTTLIMSFVGIKQRQEKAHNYFGNKEKPRKTYHLIRPNKQPFDVLKSPDETTIIKQNDDKGSAIPEESINLPAIISAPAGNHTIWSKILGHLISPYLKECNLSLLTCKVESIMYGPTVRSLLF